MMTKSFEVLIERILGGANGYLKGDYRAYEDAKRALCRNCDPDKYEQRIRWICEYLEV